MDEELIPWMKDAIRRLSRSLTEADDGGDPRCADRGRAILADFEPYDPPGNCPWECHLIGGPWIAENPDCPFHAHGAKPVPRYLGERLAALKEIS